MEFALSKIRSQSKSGLENQRRAAYLLNAVEETIKEQKEPLVPISYFGTIMSLIENAPTDDDSIIIAATYLLSFVFPYLPTSVLRLKFEDIADLFKRLMEAFEEHAPIIRSVILIYLVDWMFRRTLMCPRYYCLAITIEQKFVSDYFGIMLGSAS